MAGLQEVDGEVKPARRRSDTTLMTRVAVGLKVFFFLVVVVSVTLKG